MTKFKLKLFSILFILFNTLAYSALSTSLAITGEATFRTISDIRVTNIVFDSASDGAVIQYESEYTKDTITNGFILPNNLSSITYDVEITNKGTIDEAIYDMDIISTNNDNISIYIDGEPYDEILPIIVPFDTKKNIKVTYKTNSPDNNVINIKNKFIFKEIYYVNYDSKGGTKVNDQIKYKDIDLTLSGKPTKDNAKFLGWTDIENGEDVKYEEGDKYKKNEDVILYAIWEKDVATFLPGSEFNAKIKQLAGNINATYETVDTNITSIVRANSLPTGFTPIDANIVSTQDSDIPIYAWYDNGVIYYYTQADNPYMNQNGYSMFGSLNEVTNIDLDTINTSRTSKMQDLFIRCNSLESIDLSNFDTSNVSTFARMFQNCNSLESIDLSNFNTNNLINTSYMFAYSESIKSIKFGNNFNTSKVTNMSYMFVNCNSLKTLNLEMFDTSLVENMSSMFANCYGLISLDLSSFNTSKVEDMHGMFAIYESTKPSLTFLDISNFDLSSTTNIDNMLNGMTSLEQLKTPKVYPSDLSIQLPNTFYDSSNNSYTTLSTGNPIQEWIKLPYTVVFDKNNNDATGTMSDQKIGVDAKVKLTKKTYKLSGYAFAGWNTKADGTGTAYLDESEVKNLKSYNESITLYAQWTQNPFYTVIFEANGGTGSLSPQLFEIGVAQKLRTNTFTKENSTFWHWNTKEDNTGTSYKDEELVNNLTNVSGSTVKLYAIYESYNYVSSEPVEFDGTDFINTNIYLFSENNIKKNFEISFNISDVPLNQKGQATIVNSMEEVNPYPGFVFRIQTNGTQIEFNAPKILTKTGINITTTNKITMKRINDIYYLQVNDGNVQNLGTYSYGKTFDEPLILGKSSNPSSSRFFIGTLSNINIRLWESETYTVKFDANGGTGTMDDQKIREDETINLSANTFEKTDWLFDGWNTEPDGSGTYYSDTQSVTDLALPNESITLYAQWEQDLPYSIRFNSNGGTGTMDDQQFVYGTAQNLNINTFTKSDLLFVGWNTEPDGSGTVYKDGQSVKNLTKTENDIIYLYAMWSIKTYAINEYEFDGTNYIDTGIYLFDKGTIDRDFELSFEIVSREASQNKQATIISCMDESGSPWPGLVYRFDSGITTQQIGVNVDTNKKIEKNFDINTTKVNIKRTNGVIYIKRDDGDYEKILDMSSLDKTFHVPLTIGTSLNASGSPQRQFKGKLSNINIELF